jgi:DNA-binding GntR family transcriptional regulator
MSSASVRCTDVAGRARNAVASRPEAARVAQILRSRIISGELAPGQPVRQEEVAAELSVSRLPVREALKAIEAEGFVEHRMNAGFAVTKWSVEDFREICFMRQLLETELLATIRWPTDVELGRLTDINLAIRQVSARPDAARVVALNRDLHLAIFSLSPLRRFRAEVQRLWGLWDTYRAIYVRHASRHDPREWTTVVHDHDQIIAMLRRRNRAGLIKVSDRHRQQGMERALLYVAEVGF